MNELLIFVAIFSLQIADATQTYVAMSTGLVEEKNPLMNWIITNGGLNSMVYVKLAAAFALFGGIVYLYDKNVNTANWTLAIIIVVYLIIIMSNAYQNHKMIMEMRS